MNPISSYNLSVLQNRHAKILADSELYKFNPVADRLARDMEILYAYIRLTQFDIPPSEDIVRMPRPLVEKVLRHVSDCLVESNDDLVETPVSCLGTCNDYPVVTNPCWDCARLSKRKQLVNLQMELRSFDNGLAFAPAPVCLEDEEGETNE